MHSECCLHEFSKVFDAVSPSRLIQKIMIQGINSHLDAQLVTEDMVVHWKDNILAGGLANGVVIFIDLDVNVDRLVGKFAPRLLGLWTGKAAGI